MQSLKSKGHVKEQFSWNHYFWTLTDSGIDYLRFAFTASLCTHSSFLSSINDIIDTRSKCFTSHSSLVVAATTLVCQLR
jgi:hypothetical protein